MSIEQNVKSILSEIEKTQLVCVTKNVNALKINQAINAGVNIIGESKVQEFEDKYNMILPCRKHFIGHLQRNKVKKVVKWFDIIESVDSIKLIKEINDNAEVIKKIQNIFLQINIGEEPQKYGFKLTEIENCIDIASTYKNININGLMCIAPNIEIKMTRPYFKKMKEIFEKIKLEKKYSNLNLKYLSMGMSNDYQIAIQEGSTLVRIGSAIFK